MMDAKQVQEYLDKMENKIPSLIKNSEYTESLKLIKSLLKKEQPLEPKYIKEQNKDFFNEFYECPTCKSMISDGEIWDAFYKEPNVPHYCPNCAQKLDWTKYLSEECKKNLL